MDPERDRLDPAGGAIGADFPFGRSPKSRARRPGKSSMEVEPGDDDLGGLDDRRKTPASSGSRERAPERERERERSWRWTWISRGRRGTHGGVGVSVKWGPLREVIGSGFS